MATHKRIALERFYRKCSTWLRRPSILSEPRITHATHPLSLQDILQGNSHHHWGFANCPPNGTGGVTSSPPALSLRNASGSPLIWYSLNRLMPCIFTGDKRIQHRLPSITDRLLKKKVKPAGYAGRKCKVVIYCQHVHKVAWYPVSWLTPEKPNGIPVHFIIIRSIPNYCTRTNPIGSLALYSRVCIRA